MALTLALVSSDAWVPSAPATFKKVFKPPYARPPRPEMAANDRDPLAPGEMNERIEEILSSFVQKTQAKRGSNVCG
jgi:hypothetical protein